MYFYAVDRTGLVARQDVLKRIEEKAREIEALFRLYEVEEVKAVVLERTTAGFGLSAAEAALIVIGGLVVFGAIIGAIFICVTWKK